jgi:hypothetical protein
MELLDWKRSLTVFVPERSDSKPKKTRFDRANLVLPPQMSASGITGWRYSRGLFGALSIEAALLTAEKESFRALGLAFIGYALSDQTAEFRIALGACDGGLAQIVLWPSTYDTSLEEKLGFNHRVSVSAVHYRPKVPEGNPNYTNSDQDDPTYPREHLPFCSLGWSDYADVVLPDRPVCLHFLGTAPSLIWFGKFLLNFGLTDTIARLAYLYNAVEPYESLAKGSAELRLTESNAGQPSMFPPNFLNKHSENFLDAYNEALTSPDDDPKSRPPPFGVPIRLDDD